MECLPMPGVWSLRDYYDLLEVPRDADQKEIERAARLQLKVWHPDRLTEYPDIAHERTTRIREAYDTLRDPVKRRRYDATLMPELEETPVFTDPVQRDSRVWKRMAAYMRDEDVGTPFQRRMAYQAGDLLERRLQPTEKQLRFMREAWELAVSEGFDPRGSDDG
jgi:curved DNA-binding protein CbpA